MARLGADVEQLDRLSSRFNQDAQQVTQMVSQITSQVQSVWWEGSDATRFKSEWNSTHAPALRRVAESLRDTSQRVRQQASAQRQTSQV